MGGEGDGALQAYRQQPRLNLSQRLACPLYRPRDLGDTRSRSTLQWPEATAENRKVWSAAKRTARHKVKLRPAKKLTTCASVTLKAARLDFAGCTGAVASVSIGIPRAPK